VHLAIVEGRIEVEETFVGRVDKDKDGILIHRRKPNVREVQESSRQLKEWGFGKAVPTHQMVDPEELQISTEEEGGTLADQVDRCGRLFRRIVGRLEAQVSAGAMPDSEMVSALGQVASALAALAKEDREANKADGADQLSDDELVTEALNACPAEKLTAGLEKLPPERMELLRRAILDKTASEPTKEAKGER
jgi:hypothetical protein